MIYFIHSYSFYSSFNSIGSTKSLSTIIDSMTRYSITTISIVLVIDYLKQWWMMMLTYSLRSLYSTLKVDSITITTIDSIESTVMAD